MMSDKVKKKGLEKRWATGALDHTQQPPSKMPVSSARELARRRRVMPKTDDYYVTIRPNIESINDDAYYVMSQVMQQLAKKIGEGESLDSKDVSMYYKFADMLVKMQREERMAMADRADEFDRMTAAELEEMLREALTDDEE